MGTPPPTPDRGLLRDALAIAAAMIAVGASFGAIAIAYGMPTWVPFLMSTVVFAGGAQFLAVGLIAAGNPVAAVLAGLLLNARHLPFGLAVSTTIGPRWRDRLLGSHLMTDEVVAFTLAQDDPVRRRRTYWLIGVTLFTSWNAGTALGVWLGGATGDPATLGLDAAFPAGLLALLMPSLRDRDTRTVALLGAAVAVALTPVLPAGLPVLCALLGLLAVFRPHRHRTTPTPPEDPSHQADPAPSEESSRPTVPAPPEDPSRWTASARPEESRRQADPDRPEKSRRPTTAGRTKEARWRADSAPLQAGSSAGQPGPPDEVRRGADPDRTEEARRLGAPDPTEEESC